MAKRSEPRRAAWLAVDHLQERESLLMDSVVQLRIAVRRLAAVRNANISRWFGGSPELHGMCFEALLARVVVDLRGLVKGKGNDIALFPVALAMASEALLASGVAPAAVGAWHDAPLGQGWNELEDAIRQCPARERDVEDDFGERSSDRVMRLVKGTRLAEALPERDSVKHIIRFADKLIAHRNPIGIRDGRPYYGSLAPDYYSFDVIVDAVEAVSRIYQKCIRPSLYTLEASIGSGDPFTSLVPEEGMPGQDYKFDRVLNDGRMVADAIGYVSVPRAAWDRVFATRVGEVDRVLIRADVERHWYFGPDNEGGEELAPRWGVDANTAWRLIFSERNGDPKGED